MSLSPYFSKYFNFISDSIKSVSHQSLIEIAEIVAAVHSQSQKIILVGNGGSAAMASHIAVDFTKAAQIRAINFNEADLITCFANDYGYDQWVSEALKSYADFGDLVILISSSGQSKNIVNAALTAKELGLKVVTLSGFNEDNPLRGLGDVNLWVDSSEYNIVEMTHHIWLVAVVDYLIDARCAERSK